MVGAVVVEGRSGVKALSDWSGVMARNEERDCAAWVIVLVGAGVDQENVAVGCILV